MRSQYSSFLSMLFLFTACSSGTSSIIIEPTISTTLVSEPTTVKTVEPVTGAKNEIVLLDFAISPDGKKLAVYLNTGVYLYDIETSKGTAFYEFESDEYYSELNAGATIYPPLGAPGAVAFSSDGSKIAISDKFEDEYIFIWDLKSHEIVDYIAYYPNGNFVRELEYSPRGDTLLIRSTYPKSRIHCPELGEPPEDTLSLISLSPRRNLFERKVCTRYATVEFYFSENATYFFLFGDSSLYYMDQVDTRTGNIILSEEIDARALGRIHDVSPNGMVVAVSDTSNSSDGVLRTNLVDIHTRKILSTLNGVIDFLDNENRFLIFSSETPSQYQLYLQENERNVCTFDGLEYYRSYTRISRDNRTMAALTFDKRIFQDSIQIWDIPSCQLVKTIQLR